MLSIKNYKNPVIYNSKTGTELTESEYIFLITNEFRDAFVFKCNDDNVLRNNLVILHLCQDILIKHNFNDVCVDMLYDALDHSRIHRYKRVKCMSKEQLHWLLSQLKYVYKNIVYNDEISGDKQYNIFNACLYALKVNGLGHKSRSDFYYTFLNALNNKKYVNDNTIKSVKKIADDFLKRNNIVLNPEIKPKQATLNFNTSTINGNQDIPCECGDDKCNCNENNDIINSNEYMPTTNILCKKIDYAIKLLHIINKKVDGLINMQNNNSNNVK